MSLSSLYQEISVHLLQDDSPSIYLNGIYGKLIEYPFTMLSALRQTEQSPVHHPEGNVWNHTMLVVDQAAKVRAKSGDAFVFMWAALLHDIGKPPATKIRKGKITAYEHDTIGAGLAEKFLREFTDDAEFVFRVVQLVRYHMHILYVLKNLPFADIPGMLKYADINEVALLGMCDRLGRGNENREKEEENMRFFIERCTRAGHRRQSNLSDLKEF